MDDDSEKKKAKRTKKCVALCLKIIKIVCLIIKSY